MSALKFKDPNTGKWVTVGGIFSENGAVDAVPHYVRSEVERLAEVRKKR